MWGRNRTLAGYDRPHNFQTYVVYELPFGHGHELASHGLAAVLAGGWALNAILGRMSGTPFNVLSSGTSVNAPGNTQTADQVLPTVAILGGHGPNSPYFNPLAFAPVTAVRFGTSGRDAVRGPGFFNLDASIYRDFGIREHLKLQFRTEVYGLTNTPQFANPAATVSNATFTNGAVTNYNGYDIISSSTGDRQIRFALETVLLAVEKPPEVTKPERQNLPEPALRPARFFMKCRGPKALGKRTPPTPPGSWALP